MAEQFPPRSMSTVEALVFEAVEAGRFDGTDPEEVAEVLEGHTERLRADGFTDYEPEPEPLPEP